ncbi:uncharacterized protein LOC132390075 isoform X3 [Hypanus sabinus]|uniref:uncharacterized protein LOC132390075 isoform X3 n=1 Tax=Hypanus sabinus TaxID=79690 RepID=UPI0028C4D93F|nr:uncharacterized protein LOC132390075 isoform X3 [Hypanus sabinus]XP_059818648.1 uncharacterized protein LOC132390075 isoform X3 [Hypanus sabinus]
MDTDLNSAISAFLSNCDDHQLFRLTRFYKERLEQAIEEGVEGVSFMLMRENHFTGQEYHSVTELAKKGNRAGASKLLLDLVMERGSGARKVMWESFVKLHHHLLKLSRILNEIRERGTVYNTLCVTDVNADEFTVLHRTDFMQVNLFEQVTASSPTWTLNGISLKCPNI